AGPHVMIDAVVGEIRPASAIPAEGRLLPVEHPLPLLEPGQGLGRLAPELLRIVRGRALPRDDLRIESSHHASPLSRSLYRWIFPAAFLGRSGTNSIQRGYLYGAMRSFTNFFSSSD